MEASTESAHVPSRAGLAAVLGVATVLGVVFGVAEVF
jgi:hypothetical protein